MWVMIVEGEGADLGVNLGRPIVINGDMLFSNYFGEDSFYTAKAGIARRNGMPS